MVDLLTKNLSRVSWLKEACLDSGSYQKALRNWDKLSKLMKAHWRSGLVLCLIVWFMAVFPEKERRLLSWKMVKRNLKTHWEPQGLEETGYCRQSLMSGVWFGFCALKGSLKVSLKGYLWKFQQSRLKKVYVFRGALVVFMQRMRQNWKLAVFFEASEDDLREGNRVLRKITTLSHDH